MFVRKKTPGSKDSSTSGLSPRGHLERQAEFQIEKAETREDFVSVNHRVTEFLASYFDIIFALNEMTHPGEKRMQSIGSKECKILPKHFNENLNRLFEGMFREKISPIIKDMVNEIKTVCMM